MAWLSGALGSMRGALGTLGGASALGGAAGEAGASAAPSGGPVSSKGGLGVIKKPTAGNVGGGPMPSNFSPVSGSASAQGIPAAGGTGAGTGAGIGPLQPSTPTPGLSELTNMSDILPASNPASIGAGPTSPMAPMGGGPAAAIPRAGGPSLIEQWKEGQRARLGLRGRDDQQRRFGMDRLTPQQLAVLRQIFSRQA